MKQSFTPSEKQQAQRVRLYRICLTGILISLAMVTKLMTSIPIPVLGPGGMKIGFSGIFTALPAFLFGPIYGGIASAMSDLIGAIVKPDGPYIPWLTVTAFLGGCIKGLLWQLLRNANKKRISALLLCVFLLTGMFGAANYLSLRADGVVTSWISSKETVPTKDKITSMKLSPLSTLATQLSTYQNDTLTLTAIPAEAGSVITVPAYATVNGFRYQVKKIGANVFADCAEPLTVILTGSVTAIDENAFGDHTDVTIRSAANETVANFCKSKNFTMEEIETEAIEQAVESGTNLSGDGYTFSSNGTYRKYLSGYLNFMTFGLILIAAIGSATAILLILLSAKRGAILLFRTAISCTCAGAIVTTLNTGILRQFLAAYSGRSFLILWIPRIIEEIVVCLIQSYLIFLLLDLYDTQIRPKVAILRNTDSLGS